MASAKKVTSQVPLKFEGKQVGECDVEAVGIKGHTVHWQLFPEFEYLENFYRDHVDEFYLSVALDSGDYYRIREVTLGYAPKPVDAKEGEVNHGV